MPSNRRCVWYHGTKDLEGIIKTGALGRSGSATWLSATIDEAICHGPHVLAVRYDPSKDPTHNNYHHDCWQMRVYTAIPVRQLTLIGTPLRRPTWIERLLQRMT